MAVQLGDAVVSIFGDDSKLKKQLNNVGKKMKSLGKGMVVAGGAITASFGLMAKGAIDFQAQMANVATLGVTNLDELEKGVKRISKQFGVNATQAATDLYDVISAGIPEDAAIMVMEEAMRGAKAGVGSLGDALDLGTSLMNAFGLAGENANETTENFRKIMGQAATAVKFGKTTIEDLGKAVGRGAGLMASAGVKTGEFLAAIATLTTTGAPAAEQVSALKAAVAGIIKPTSEAATMAESLKLEFNAQALEAKGLKGFLDSVAKATGNDIEKMGQLFGSIEALNAVITLTDSKADSFTEALDGMANASENLNTMVKAQMEADPSLTWDRLRATLNVLALNIGKILIPALDKIAKKIISVVNVFSGWVEKYPKLTELVVKFAAGLGLIMVVLGPLLIFLPALVAGIGMLIGPIGLVIAGIAALAAGVAVLATAWINNWGGIRDKTMAVIDWIREGLSAFWEEIQPEVKQALDVIWNYIKIALDGIKAFWKEHSDGIMALLEAMWAYLGAVAELYLNIIIGVIKVALDVIQGDWSGAWDNVKKIFAEVMISIKKIWDAGWDIIYAAIIAGLGLAVSAVNSLIALINKIPFVDLGEIGGGAVSPGGGLGVFGGPGNTFFRESVRVLTPEIAPAAAGGNGFNFDSLIHVENLSVREEADIYKIADQLGDLVTRKLRMS